MRFSFAGALLVSALLAAGCDDSTTNVIEVPGGVVIASRVDDLAYPVSDNWNWPTGYSINPVKARDIRYVRSFRCTDGAGIVTWQEGNTYEDDPKSFLFMAFYDAEGSLMPAVEILGSFRDRRDAYFNQVNVVWTPNGDAVIAFLARQSEDPTDEADRDSDRVYYTYFRRLYAELPVGPTGETYGFRQWAEPVDTNVVGQDDNGVDNIFVATNLSDEVLWWSERAGADDDDDQRNPMSESITGYRGDTCFGAPFVYLGWVHDNADEVRRVEGGFVDLDTLAFSNADVAPIATSPPIADTDSVGTFVLTCGRDIFLQWRETLGPGAEHEHLNLVRVNPARDGLEATIDITRGTGETEINEWSVAADNFRVLNGQTTTWVFFRQRGFTGTGVTQPDEDLLIAQINAAGEVQIGEYDDNPPDSEEERGVNNIGVQYVRGATRAFVYYSQPTSGSSYRSMFCRAVRLDGSRDLADNVSNQVRCNTRDAVSDDSSIYMFRFADIDPFRSAQTNNNVSCLLYQQRLPEQSTGLLAQNGSLPPQLQFMYARQEITDFNATPPVLTTQAIPIIDSLDWTDDTNIEQRPYLVPMNSPTGDHLVFFVVNGNNLQDHNAEGAFPEPRPFVWDPSLAGPVEIGSNNPSGPAFGFGNYAILDGAGDERRISALMAGATPDIPADRDCAFDDDVATPNFAHVFFFEYMRDPEGGRETIWRGRVIDLRGDTFQTTDRILPPLAERPFAIGTGNNAVNWDRLDGPYFYAALEGDNVMLVFNEVWGQRADPGYVYVNTFDPGTRRWSRASLASTDAFAPIGNHGGSPDMLLVPGVAPGGAGDRIVGGWIFWIRSPTQDWDYANDVDLLQGRRIFDVNLPE